MSARMQMRRAPGMLMAVLMVLVVAIGAPSEVWAHSSEIGTSPEEGAVLEAAPSAVEVEFDSPLLDVGAAIVVRSADGTSITTAPPVVGRTSIRVDVDPQAPSGEYTVAYRVASVDGHSIESTFGYTVGGGEPLDAGSTESSAASPPVPSSAETAAPSPPETAPPASPAAQAAAESSGANGLPIAMLAGVLLALTLAIIGAIALRR